MLPDRISQTHGRAAIHIPNICPQRHFQVLSSLEVSAMLASETSIRTTLEACAIGVLALLTVNWFPSFIPKASRKVSVSLIGCDCVLVIWSVDRHAMPVPVVPSEVTRVHNSPGLKFRESKSFGEICTLKVPSRADPEGNGRTVKEIWFSIGSKRAKN